VCEVATGCCGNCVVRYSLEEDVLSKKLLEKDVLSGIGGSVVQAVVRVADTLVMLYV